MTSADRLLNDLTRLGIALRVEDGNLRWHSPNEGVMTPARLTLLRVHKAGIIHLLRSARTSAVPRSCERDDREALYEYAKHMRFPAVVLTITPRSIEAGEQSWRLFAECGGQYELWEAADELIRMEDAAGGCS